MVDLGGDMTGKGGLQAGVHHLLSDARPGAVARPRPLRRRRAERNSRSTLRGFSAANSAAPCGPPSSGPDPDATLHEHLVDPSIAGNYPPPRIKASAPSSGWWMVETRAQPLQRPRCLLPSTRRETKAGSRHAAWFAVSAEYRTRRSLAGNVFPAGVIEC
jgi:hypothetical protein